MFVKDFNTKKWLTSDEAVFISVENINSPMGFGLIAVSDKDSADKIISEHGGNSVGNFDNVTEFIIKK